MAIRYNPIDDIVHIIYLTEKVFFGMSLLTLAPGGLVSQDYMPFFHRELLRYNTKITGVEAW